MAHARSPSAKAPGPPAAPRRGGGPKALGDSVRKITHRALGQRSLAEQNLILDWPSIAGGEIARTCTPQGISFERRDQRRDGTLSLKVRPGEATRLQHLEPQLIERINGYLGYRAVARLRLLQGSASMGGGHEDTHRAPDDPPAPNQESGEPPIGDPALRTALARLGRAVKPSSR